MREETEKLIHELETVADKASMALEKLVDAPASKLAEFYVAHQELFDEVETIFKRLGETRSRLREQLIPAAFDRESITSFTTKSKHRVTVSQKVFASIIKDNEQQAFSWLRTNGLGDLIKPTVNASSLSAAAKEMLGEMKEMPPDFFKVATLPTTSFTKAK